MALLVRTWLESLRAVVIATRPLGMPEHWACDLVREDQPIKRENALQFWTGVGRAEWWPGLAWRFQTDTRRWLMQARAAAMDGKDAGALFMAGCAWVSSQAAVLPEAEVRQAMDAQKAKEAQAAMDAERLEMIRPTHR